MTGTRELAAVLADGRSGVLERASDAVGAAEAGHRAGWHVVHLEGGVDRGEFLATCADAFALPEWFGHNWDALADALSDVQHEPGTLVLWSHASRLPDDVRATALDVFADRATDGPHPFLLVRTTP